MSSKNRIAILTRFPRLGEVKTRLVPPLTQEGALDLHSRLARHTLATARALDATGDASVEVRTDAAFPRLAYGWLGKGFAARYQGEGDLGERIRIAFAENFPRGFDRVVVVGSDCPRLSAAHLRDALARLATVDVVLGPAADGGYYLVGLRRQTAKRSVPVLFGGLAWGGPDVLAQTLAIAEENGLTHALLETLPDVDRPEDLADAEAALAARELPADARVSAVIPALNDSALVGDAVRAALRGGAAETIVVDGGSGDDTRERAVEAGARVIESAPGRARQMNAGAAEADGDVLLFVHADTLVPPEAARLARISLARPGVVAGAFGFSVPAGGRWSRLLTFVGRTRARLTHHPHGDQGLYLSSGMFADMGGFPQMPTMEDWELVARLRRLGRVEVLGEPAMTSARAWEEHGIVRSTLLNLAVIVAYRMGVDPERLARWRARIAPASRAGVRPEGGER